MGPLPQLQVTVDAKGWSCILDMRLALDPRGPMFALRLAEELRVFLVPSLWQVLDNTTYYERHPARLYRDPLAADPAAVIAGLPSLGAAGALAQWEAARLELGLSALRVYWAGDAVHESSLPKDVDPGVVTRFARLAEAMAQRLATARPELDSGWPLLEGGRDAGALAIAMARYRPVIFTLGAQGKQGEPALVRLLRSCDVQCRALDPADTRYHRAYLAPLLARCGGLELAWSGAPLVALHLVAPAAFLMPPVAAEGDEPIELDRVDSDWLHGATAYWYPLS